MEKTLPLQHNTTRDTTLDAVKGIGIILMVLGHSGGPFHDFVYLFHMALFFMVSGFLWNDKKVADLPTACKSLLARLKGLLLPFALCNGIFTLLQTPLNRLLINPTTAVDLSFKQTAIKLVKNMLFAGETNMGGATWFLRTLFFVYAAHTAIRYLVCHIKWGKVLFGIVVAVNLIATVFIDHTNLSLPMGISGCFSSYCAFLLGMLLRRLNILEKLRRFDLPIAIVCFLLLCLLSPLGPIGIGIGSIVNLPLFFAASLLGFFMSYCTARCLKGWVGNTLAYCGRHSIWIVTLHFLAFKPVALVYLLLTGKDMVHLADFPVYAVSWLWIVYTIVGTILPLAVYQLWKAIFCKKNRR